MMTFEEIFSFPVLYRAYKRARIGKRKHTATAQYEANAIYATERLAHILATRAYKPSKFEVFYVYEPKKRLVQAPAFVDKVVQHALVDNYLYDTLTRSFIHESTATQIGKGTHVGLDCLKFHMTDYFRKRKGRDEIQRRETGLPPRPMAEWEYAQGWVLKADVRKFFASINHDILKTMLRKKVGDDKIYDLMCVYIDHTPEGLPLGYQTSQLLALMYLDAFDHWIKETLGIKYYGRYSDDFYLSETDKVVRKLRQSGKKRMMSRIKRWKHERDEGAIDLAHVWASYTVWDAHAAHGDTRELRIKIREIMNSNFKEVIDNGNDAHRQ